MLRDSAPDLNEALASASAYWDSIGSPAMGARAALCADLLGRSTKLASLQPAHATSLITRLQDKGRSRATVQAYYTAFKRMLKLAGVSTLGWPSAPKAPRKAYRQEALELSRERIREAGQTLVDRGWSSTKMLLEVLAETGLRANEALNWDAWLRLEEGLLVVRGKGGHERAIPIKPWLAAYWKANEAFFKKVPYDTHHQRLITAGIPFRFHDIRRWYATEAYKRSGRDLMAVKNLLGHSDVATTARYVGVDMDSLREAAGA